MAGGWQLALNSRDAAGALAAYNEALSIEARDADLLANAAVAASDIGDSALAIQYGQAALAINPLHANARHNLAAELSALGRLDESRHHVHLENDQPSHALH